jgi:hypothetical protein
MPQFTVACVKSGSKYGPEYVQKLQSMVARNLSLPHQFLCLTDDANGLDCETAKLDTLLHGWWHKLTLFRADPYGIQGRILFLDLDVVIVGPLDDLVLYPAPFAIPRDFMSSSYASCSFTLDVGALPQVWEQFDFNETPKRYYGDQDWITAAAPGAAIYPKEWVVSYKLAAKDGPPVNARVVAFHGLPKMADCNGWVTDAWC